MKNMLNLRILKRPVGRPGGWLWVLVLLALPRCAGLIGVEDWSPAKLPLARFVWRLRQWR